MDTCVRWIPGAGKILWRRAWQPTQVFLLGESHGQRSLVGYSPWGCKRAGYNLATKQQHQQAVGSSTVCAWWLQNERSFVSVWIRFLWLPWQSTIDWGSEDNRHLFSSCPGGLKLEISEARPSLPFPLLEAETFPGSWLPSSDLCSVFMWLLPWVSWVSNLLRLFLIRALSLDWHACLLSRFSHVWLCDCMGDNPPGSSVCGILHARILEWVAVPSFRGASGPRDRTVVSGIYLL